MASISETLPIEGAEIAGVTKNNLGPMSGMVSPEIMEQIETNNMGIFSNSYIRNGISHIETVLLLYTDNPEDVHVFYDGIGSDGVTNLFLIKSYGFDPEKASLWYFSFTLNQTSPLIEVTVLEVESETKPTEKRKRKAKSVPITSLDKP